MDDTRGCQLQQLLCFTAADGCSLLYFLNEKFSSFLLAFSWRRCDRAQWLGVGLRTGKHEGKAITILYKLPARTSESRSRCCPLDDAAKIARASDVRLLLVSPGHACHRGPRRLLRLGSPFSMRSQEQVEVAAKGGLLGRSSTTLQIRPPSFQQPREFSPGLGLLLFKFVAN